MKHISENFENAHVVSLSDDELLGLSLLIDDLKKKRRIHGIYLLPRYEEIDCRYYDDGYARIQVTIVAQNSERAYEELLNYCNKYNDFLEFKSYIPTNKFEYDIQDINDYTLNDDSFMSGFYRMYLVSSYIVYDRHGYLEWLQDSLKDKKEPMENLVNLDNIDKLEIVDNKTKKKKKKYTMR